MARPATVQDWSDVDICSVGLGNGDGEQVVITLGYRAGAVDEAVAGRLLDALCFAVELLAARESEELTVGEVLRGEGWGAWSKVGRLNGELDLVSELSPSGDDGEDVWSGDVVGEGYAALSKE